jgi:hypothetical protein
MFGIWKYLAPHGGVHLQTGMLFGITTEWCSASERNRAMVRLVPLGNEQQRVGREELFEGEPGRDPSRSLMYRVGMLVFSQGLPIPLTFRFKVAAR